MRVSVIGGGTVDESIAAVAHDVGRLLGERGHEVVCGGRGGVMAAACRGANEAGARTIGILPGTNPDDANECVDVPIVTGLGNARNALVVANGDAAIAIDGRYGTLSEIALALDSGIPVAAIDSHDVEGVRAVDSAKAAVDYVETNVSE